MAISMNNQNLKSFCERNIRSLTNKQFNIDIFLHCDPKVVKHVLQLETLSCGGAHSFMACIAWAKQSCEAKGLDKNVPENLKNQLGDCFYLIQFASMEDEEIGVILSNKLYGDLFTKEELADIFCMKSIQDFQPKIFRRLPRSQHKSIIDSQSEISQTISRPQHKWDTSKEFTFSTTT